MSLTIRKTWYTLVLIVWMVFASYAQKQEVISSSGGHLTGSRLSISYTLGETVITTQNNNDMMLTQGFHQSQLVVTALDEMKGLSITINAFPNPVNDYLNVVTSKLLPQGSFYQLFNMYGELIRRADFEGTNTEVEFRSLVSATYLLTVNGKNQILKSLKNKI